jgi:SAM-dependent methyltransferase
VALVKAAVLAALCLCAIAARAQGEDVPFVVTPDRVTREMLQLAQVGPDDFVLDLGSGDGRIVIAAARLYGARGLGVEIVPALVEQSRENARRAGVAERTEFRVQDLFATDLARATVITMYLLPEVNLQLRSRLLALKPGTRIVSHDWDLGDWPPDRTLTVAVPEKAVGLDKHSRLHLWTVPSPVHGRWCGPAGQVLDITQRYQQLQLDFAAAMPPLTATLDGTALHAGPGLSMRVDDGPVPRMQVGAAAGAWAALAGASFTAGGPAGCQP